MGIGILIIFVVGVVLLALIFASSDDEPERHGVGGGKTLPVCHAVEDGKRCVRMRCDVHHTIHHLHIEDLDHAA